MKKKAAINISVRFVVIIIIALVIFLLLIAFIRYLFEESSIKMDEEISRYAKPPVVIISSPSPVGIYTVFQQLKFDGSKSYDRYYRIIGYFWDFDSDSIIDSRKDIDYYSYSEPGEYNLTLKVVNDPGAIGAASQIVRVVTNNSKKEGLENSLFLIRDNDRVNEETILRLIPVTTWWDINGFHRLPYYVYYFSDTGSSLTEGQLENIMQSYGKKHAYVFDDSKLSNNYCDGSNYCKHTWDDYTIDIYKDLDYTYFDFWDLYEYVVLVNRNETDDKLIASLFAAFYNSPIIFIDSTNLGIYENQIINNFDTKLVYYIPSFESIDDSVSNFITDNNLYYKSYSGEELRTGTVKRVIRWDLVSNVTMH